MFDTTLAHEILRQNQDAAGKILSRMETIQTVSDFTESPAGMEKMDSICMLLIVIGESLKNLDEVTHEELLSKYPQIDWKKAKGMRDILTHHYSDVSAEAVFHTCLEKIKPLHDVVQNMIEEL